MEACQQHGACPQDDAALMKEGAVMFLVVHGPESCKIPAASMQLVPDVEMRSSWKHAASRSYHIGQ